MKREEVGFVVEYLASTSDADQVVEVLDVLLSLCDRGSSNKMVKRLSGITPFLPHTNTRGRFVYLFVCLQHLLSMVLSGSRHVIGHVVPSRPGSFCRGGGDSPTQKLALEILEIFPVKMDRSLSVSREA